MKHVEGHNPLLSKMIAEVSGVRERIQSLIPADFADLSVVQKYKICERIRASIDECRDYREDNGVSDESRQSGPLPVHFHESVLAELNRFDSDEKHDAELLLNALNTNARTIRNKKVHPGSDSPEVIRVVEGEHTEFVQETMYSLHRMGYQVTVHYAEFAVKRIWDELPSVQIPIGICSDPRKVDSRYTRGIDIIPVLFEAERGAMQDDTKRRIVVYDTPQITNYLHLEHEDNNSGVSVADYLRSLAEEQNYSLKEAARDVALRFGKRDVGFFKHITDTYELKNTEIVSFSDIEQDPLFQALRHEIAGIVDSDEALLSQLSKTVNGRLLKKAGIGIPGQSDPLDKAGIRRELAEYAIKMVVLHVWNLGDTICHDGETKNYRLTKALVKNRSYQQRILDTFQRFGKRCSADQLKDLQFPKPDFFQGVSLGLAGPERYRTYVCGKQEMPCVGADQVLLCRNQSVWSGFLSGGNQKQGVFLDKVIGPLLAGHYHFKYKERAREKLSVDVQSISSLEGLAELVQAEVVKPLLSSVG